MSFRPFPILFTVTTLALGCSDPAATADEEIGTSQLEWSTGTFDTEGPTDENTPIGLALEIDQGAGVPIRVRAGQRLFIDQIDIRAAIDTDVDEGVAGLDHEGDFAALDWRGVRFEEQEFVGIPNPDGTFTRRRFYRGARWMRKGSFFLITQVDAYGRPTAWPWIVNIGKDSRRRPFDSFFVRRLRAIQWTFDCAGPDDCSTAHQFQEEGLVEVRHSEGRRRVARLRSDTAALRVRWSLNPRNAYEVPVEQVDDPDYDYNFAMNVDTVTPPGPGGVYAPGTDIKFRFTLTDGSGSPLHPEGSLPTYNEAVFGPDPAGIQYYRAFGFIDPTATYYRRKHRERMLMAQIIGPAQSIQPIRSIIDLDAFLGEEDSQITGTPERDGVFSEFQTVPPANDLFGGNWDAPVNDEITFHLPENAEPGTYLVTLKGRRTYLGQDIPRSETIELQVGTPHPTEPTLTTGPCNTCHSDGSDLSVILHANDNRAACAGCHVPLGFELEGPIFVRTHFIHSRSNRFDVDSSECSNCHLTQDGIERTSKAACLSCHSSYPDDHVATYGPIESMYIGGGRESFDQCSDSCHSTHPNSGLQ